MARQLASYSDSWKLKLIQCASSSPAAPAILGSAIVRALARHGHEPVVFARRASTSGLPGTPVDGDVRDRRRSARRCAESTRSFTRPHSSACGSPPRSLRRGQRRRSRGDVLDAAKVARHASHRLHIVISRAAADGSRRAASARTITSERRRGPARWRARRSAAGAAGRHAGARA